MHATETAQRMSATILRFCFTKEAFFIPAAIKAFQGKIVFQLLYSFQLCIYKEEAVQFKFLGLIFGVPQCIPNALLKLETGPITLENHVWLFAPTYWLQLIFTPVGLTFLIFADSHPTIRQRVIEGNIQEHSFFP